jgi:DDE superfamily endonuclease
MWSVVPSLQSVLQGLLPVFTQPSFVTHSQVALGWLMCLGQRTEFRVFEASFGQRVSRRGRHPFDRFYNFFSRSAWNVRDLAHSVAVQLVLALDMRGELRLIVDGTLLHKSGKHVWAIGWFHDPVASTKKRVATALGNKWVVLGLAVPIPGTQRIFCLPIHAMLQKPGRGQAGEPALARMMLEEVRQWFPERRLLLVADGGFSAKNLLRDLDGQVRYVGLMRGDAALHEPQIAPRRPGQRGPNRKYGLRLPSPREAACLADQAAHPQNFRWKTVRVFAYGQLRRFQVCSFEATWPKVFGKRAIQVVLCRALDVGYDEVYLYTTDLQASADWVVETYAGRTSIESTFKNSKQVLEIERPQHWCQGSIEKLAPWVWLMQSLVSLWYLTEGRHLPEARAARQSLGAWETEWSLRHMLRLLRRVTLRQAIDPTSRSKHDLQQLTQQLENYLYLAA